MNFTTVRITHGASPSKPRTSPLQHAVARNRPARAESGRQFCPRNEVLPHLDELLSRLVEKVPVESAEPADTVVLVEASTMARRVAC